MLSISMVQFLPVTGVGIAQDIPIRIWTALNLKGVLDWAYLCEFPLPLASPLTTITHSALLGHVHTEHAHFAIRFN